MVIYRSVTEFVTYETKAEALEMLPQSTHLFSDGSE